MNRVGDEGTATRFSRHAMLNHPPVASRQEDTGAEEKEGSRCLKF